MDMAPRWEQGYGFQTRFESYGSSTLMQGESKIANPSSLKRYVNKTWLEGVYTFDRARRITFKLPYIEQTRHRVIAGRRTLQDSKGFGDLVIGVPLKHYRNNKAFTDNFSFTPSIRFPTGNTTGDFPISDGSVDLGFSLSYSSESPRYYSLVDVFYWINREGKRGMDEGNETGIDINLGYHPLHSDDLDAGLFVMWDFTARHNENPGADNLTAASGGTRLQTGPVLVLYKDNIMLRAEYKHLTYEKKNQVSNSRGSEFSIGIGITF